MNKIKDLKIRQDGHTVLNVYYDIVEGCNIDMEINYIGECKSFYSLSLDVKQVMSVVEVLNNYLKDMGEVI